MQLRVHSLVPMVLVSLLIGCSTFPGKDREVRDKPVPQDLSRSSRIQTQPSERVTDPSQDIASEPAPHVAPPTAGEAVVALLGKAQEQAQAGNGEKAAAILERALKLEPHNPWLWHRLAVLRLQQDNWDAAQELAAKSNSLADGNVRLLAGNWQVIAGALSGMGDHEGATKAGARSDSLFEQARRHQ